MIIMFLSQLIIYSLHYDLVFQQFLLYFLF